MNNDPGQSSEHLLSRLSTLTLRGRGNYRVFRADRVGKGGRRDSGLGVGIVVADSRWTAVRGGIYSCGGHEAGRPGMVGNGPGCI
jgi:hypothetical protein